MFKFFKRGTGIVVLAASLLLLLPIAQAQDTLKPDTPLVGTYDGQFIEFTIAAEPLQLITITLESDAFNPFVTANRDGFEIAFNDDIDFDNTNARITFAVTDDAVYTVQVDSFDFDVNGEFTLAMEVAPIDTLGADESLTLTPATEGTTSMFAIVEGTAGEIYNINAATDDSVFYDLLLLDSESVELARASSGTVDNVANIRRAVLPADGTYVVQVMAVFFDESFEQPVTVSLESTTLDVLNDEAIEVVFGEGADQQQNEVFGLEVVAGNLYRIRAELDGEATDTGLRMELLGTSAFFAPSVEFTDSSGIVWEYVALDTGTLRLDVRPSFFASSDGITYRFTAEEVAAD